MEDNYTIQVKIKPILKEWIENKYGKPPVASMRNNFGLIIRPFISVAPADYKYKKLTGDDVLEFIIPRNNDFDIRHQTVYIPEPSFYTVEQAFWGVFSEIFVAYIDSALLIQPKIGKCICQFISNNNLTYTEELHFNLRQKYWRAKTKGEISSESKKTKINTHLLKNPGSNLFLL